MTTRSHIAMFSIAAHGHVNPSLEVIRELVARGHRVTYAVPPLFAEKVAETGAEVKPWNSTLPLSPNLVAWRGYEEEVAEPMWAEPKRTERGRAYYARFHNWLEGNGVTTDPDTFVGRPDRSLVLIPKALQPNADRVDESVYTFVGACQGDRGAEGEWQRPAAVEKVALVSLGSSFTRRPDFYKECVRAFGDLPGWHLVLQIGRHVDPAELGTVPDNVEVRSWVPQLAVLKQAHLFVTHAGAGGSQEGLATATPMIAVPQAVDQFGNADMLQGLGVARRIDTEEATAEALKEAALALVDDPEVARRLKEVQAEMAQEGGTRRAADLIEAALPA